MPSVSVVQLRQQFQYIYQNYYVAETGGWRFAITMDTDEDVNEPLIYDLYAHAFVLFMCVWVFMATRDDEAKDIARNTLAFIQKHFKDKQCGFVEQLNEDLQPIPQMRRQNPHMHLFEACIFAHECWPDEAGFAQAAHELKGLFINHFWDVDKNAMGEFFDDGLKPHPEKGDVYEPGHHFEWVWLLNRYEQAFGSDEELQTYRQKLLDFGNRFGRDGEYGGIFNAVNNQGQVIDADKRIWPLTEALKANAIMLHDKRDRDTVKEL